MLSQTLSIHHTTGAVATLLQNWREDMGNLAETRLPVALVVSDVLAAIGVPDNAIRLVLSAEEYDQPAPRLAAQAETGLTAICQGCGETATQLVEHHRRGHLLLCDDCAVLVNAR